MSIFALVLSFILMILAVIYLKHDHVAAASPVSWSSSSVRVSFDYRFVDSPSSDVHVTTGFAMSCSSSPSVSQVWSGGKASGFDCYDSAGVLLYSEYCRLDCLPDESLTSTAITTLKAALAEVASAVQSSPLQVRSADNTTISFTSDLTHSCDGMKVLTTSTTPNTNLVIFVTARPLRQLGIPRPFYAQSTFCEFMPASSRPAVARLNVDPRYLNQFAASAVTDSSFLAQLKTILAKEMVHTLGFSSSLMPSFRHPSDPTRTYYNFDPAAFPSGPVSGARVVSVGPGNFSFGAKTTAKMFFLGPATKNVASIFFACSSIMTTAGVELENGGDTGQSVSNLEKRIFPNELLVADWNGTLVKTSAQLFSLSLTLSLLHDTGFFFVPQFSTTNSSISLSALNFAGNFGQGLGCSFAQGRCVIPNWPSTYTCSTVGGGCGVGDVMGRCDIMTYPTPLPLAYQYFSDIFQGGGDKYMDYCPKFSEIPRGNCKVPLSANSSSSSSSLAAAAQSGMRFGSNSKCSIAQVVLAGYVAAGISVPSCYAVVCDMATQVSSYFVVGTEELVKCSNDNDVLELFPPPRANVYIPKLSTAATTTGSTLVYSYAFHGLVSCSTIPSQCQNDVTGLPRISKPNPVVASITPPWGTLSGGVTVMIAGSRLTGCTGMRIGGVAMRDFRVLNDSAATATTGVVPDSGVEGGDNLIDATGDSLVQLLCPIPSLAQLSICPSGCIVGRWYGLYNYSETDPNAPAPPPPAKTFFSFFTTPAGKSVGILLCLLTTVLIAFVIRKSFNYCHGIADEKTFGKASAGKDIGFLQDFARDEANVAESKYHQKMKNINNNNNNNNNNKGILMPQESLPWGGNNNSNNSKMDDGFGIGVRSILKKKDPKYFAELDEL